MIEWVPIYESLYENEKLGVRHTARSVYAGLCLKARKDKGDRVRLPRGAAVVDGVWMLVGGTRHEVEDALRDDACGLLYPKDPMIRVEGEEGAWSVLVLRRDRWTLEGARGDDGQSVAEPRSPNEAKRAAEAKRKRDERARRKETRPSGGGVLPVPTAPDAGPESSGHAPDASPDGGPDASEKRPPDAPDASADKWGVRGDVYPLGTKKRPEEKREQESRRARASAGRDLGRAPDGPPDATSDEHRTDRRTRLLNALRRSPDLRQLEQAQQLDLTRCARDLATDGDNYVIGGKLRDDEIDERLDAAVADLVREVAAAASTSQPMPPREIARKVRTFAKATLGKSREEWRSRSDRGSAPQHPDMELTLEIFGTAWEARKHRAFVRADGDERHAAKLAEQAREHAKRLKILPRDVVRHWADQYLRDGDRFVADQEHPLRLLPTRLTSYGLPRPAPLPHGPEAPPTEPAEPLVGPPAGFADALAKVGGAGAASGEPLSRPRIGRAS